MSPYVVRNNVMPDDQDDRKALNLLVQKLFDKSQVTSISSPKSYKFKQNIVSQSNRFKHKTVTPPLDLYGQRGWIKIDKTKHGKKCLSVSETTTETIKALEKVKGKEDYSRKYGIKVPTFEEVIATNKKLENDVHNVNRLIDGVDPLPDHINLNLPEYSTNQTALDCKHLSELEIENACKRNYQYILEIHTGCRYSERYKLFKRNDHQNNLSSKDLRYNTSMITFTFGQKQRLLAFLNKHFCDYVKNIAKTDDYFFKVLLPELCLKIFMDTHNMDQNEAVNYLDQRPIG